MGSSHWPKGTALRMRMGLGAAWVSWQARQVRPLSRSTWRKWRLRVPLRNPVSPWASLVSTSFLSWQEKQRAKFSGSYLV